MMALAWLGESERYLTLHRNSIRSRPTFELLKREVFDMNHDFLIVQGESSSRGEMKEAKVVKL